MIPPGTYVQGSVSHAKRSGRVKGRAELGIRLETMTFAGGKMAEDFAAPERGRFGRDRPKSGRHGESGEAGGHASGKTPGRWRFWRARGAAIGGLADRSFKGAGIGAGVGNAVGLATVLLTRGNEVELHQGTTLDVVFDRDVVIE